MRRTGVDLTILAANLPKLPLLLFALGFAFALVPTVGPFVALLLLFGQAFTFQRTDALWLLGAVLAAIPAAISARFAVYRS